MVMTCFRPIYFYWTIGLLIVEVLIALFLHDGIIRPFVGDVLVVILIYCFIRTFLRVKVNVTIGAVFLFACLVEGLQFIHIVDRLGLSQNKVASIIIGTAFDWKDIIAYGIGCAIVYYVEYRASKTRLIKS
jgi:hypothetical protein